MLPRPAIAAVALAMTLAVMWGAMSCAWMCALEESLLAGELRHSESVAAGSTSALPNDDGCYCPDSIAMTAAVQHREAAPHLIPAAVPLMRDGYDPPGVVAHQVESAPPPGRPPLYAFRLFIRLGALRI